MQGAWSEVSPQLMPVAGGPEHPSVRYSACAVAYDNQLVVTHGYHYDHDARHPAWKSDAWSYNFDTNAWRKVHEGERDGAPSARYSGTCILWDHALWMYGGDDGGHKWRMHNYVFGAHFSEMWRLDLRTFKWRKVEYTTAAPIKRALHAAAVVGNTMYVHGGLELSDTWRFDLPSRSWKELAVSQPVSDPNHPGRRHAHAMVEGDSCVYTFGGGQHKPLQVFNDLHKYSFTTDSWSLVTPSGRIPGARSHYSLLALSPRVLLLYGGALCTPGCKCYGDTWVFDTAASEWSVLNATDAPIHRYRQSLVLNEADGSLYLFGGESYKPYMYHNAVNKLVLSGEKLGELLPAATSDSGWRKGKGKGKKERQERATV